MDQEVGPAAEVDESLVVAVGELVICQVDKDPALGGDPKADAPARVVGLDRGDLRRANADWPLVHLGELNRGAEPGELQGEVGAHHLIGERLAELLARHVMAVDSQAGAGQVGGLEKGKALDVIPMTVAEEEVRGDRLLAREHVAEPADAGAGIQDEHLAVVKTNGDAGGVATVSDGELSWRRDRAAGAPDLNSHGCSPFARVALTRFGLPASREEWGGR